MTNKTTTIEISIENYDKLHSIKKQLDKIVKKKLSLNKIISILVCAKQLEDQLIEMQVENFYPSTTQKEESTKHDQKEEKEISQNPREGT